MISTGFSKQTQHELTDTAWKVVPGRRSSELCQRGCAKEVLPRRLCQGGCAKEMPGRLCQIGYDKKVVPVGCARGRVTHWEQPGCSEYTAP